ncbi:NYN domain-containing protein [Patescibacteria group bacterium]|nr:NYN domain-containing protein [Patescibacteria group bacterium]MBU1967071.1 NYN domain-containing protein [Patescibacteria group bacterium]MBU2543290.1 NYN domain-containing protein [Patescibacteria group bacterium]
MSKMSKSTQIILYIDSENLKYYIRKIGLKHHKKITFESFNFEQLFSTALNGINVSIKRFYAAKLRFYPESPKKSQELIQRQRSLKANLEKQKFVFIKAGNVRGQKIKVNDKEKVVFHEKGVDVHIAVDMTTESCDGKVKTIILCSSDSDLQPAIYEAKKRNVEVIYLGLESQPNKGLIYTCDRAILIRDSEVLAAVGK